jgi:hypothetical protein
VVDEQAGPYAARGIDNTANLPIQVYGLMREIPEGLVCRRAVQPQSLTVRE